MAKQKEIICNQSVYREIKKRLEINSCLDKGRKLLPKWKAKLIIGCFKNSSHGIWEFGKREQKIILSELHKMKAIKIRKNKIELI